MRELTWALLPEAALFAAAAHNRAGVSKFYFRCFQHATSSNSDVRAVPELRIELPATLEHARGPEIG